MRTRTTDYLAQYSTLILPDGTLPPLTVQNAGSMAHWVWMCLVLRHDAVLARETICRRSAGTHRRGAKNCKSTMNFLCRR
ncbi:MAG: hypothetical protein ACLT29_00510 [Ruminococcus callidus]